MRFIEIRNIKNTPDDALPLGYSSWLDYWETKKGRKAYTCSVINCRNSPDVGGHVRDAQFGHSEYILPMCRSCHSKSEEEFFGAWTNDLLILAVPIFPAEGGYGGIECKDGDTETVADETHAANEDLVVAEEISDETVKGDGQAESKGVGTDKMVNKADKEKNDLPAAFDNRKDDEKEYGGSSSRTADLIKSSIGGVSLDQSRIDQIISAYRAKMAKANMTKTDIMEIGVAARETEKKPAAVTGGDRVYNVEKKGEMAAGIDGQSAVGKDLAEQPVTTATPEAVSEVMEARERVRVDEDPVADVTVPIKKDTPSAPSEAAFPAEASIEDAAGVEVVGGGVIEAAPTARIYLASPHMGNKELVYVKDAFESNWIAPLGPHVDCFEREVAEYVGARSAVALNSGTAAIHMALKAVGVEEGDTVFCSSFTFAGSCNPILYMNAIPVFIDSEPNSLNMSPPALEKAFQKHRPRAVIVVNLYGQSADYDKIVEICNRYNTPIIEDAAESLGATYKGKMSGTLGKLGIFSFNGNKIITTSGGGMVVSDDEEMIERIRFWATQARDPAKHYQHSELGYNYRLSNICAAIGRGQMTVLEERIAQKKSIYGLYQEAFANEKYIMMMPICDYGEPNYWLSVMMIKEGCNVTPMEIIDALEKENIESRPVWKPMHLQPLYAKFDFYHHLIEGFSVAGNIYQKGLCLPSDTKMKQADIKRIIDIVKKVMN